MSSQTILRIPAGDMSSTQTLPLVLADDDGNVIKIEIRQTDGYVNATKLCHALGKEWKNYYAVAKNKEYLAELSKSEKIPVEKVPILKGLSTIPSTSLVELGKNRYQNTWVHPDVAIHLAGWARAKYGVAVIRLVRMPVPIVSQISPTVEETGISVPPCLPTPPMYPDGFPTLFEFARQKITDGEHLNLFLASIVAALTESKENKFSVDFDQAVAWLDVRKADLKRTLLKIEKLRKDVDYTIFSKFSENPQVGRKAEEEIKLTVDAFKLLCLSTKGKRPDSVREYFIGVEKIIVQYAIAQRDAEIEQLRARLPITLCAGRDNSNPTSAEFRIRYENVPSGPKFYRRLSIANYVDGIEVPPNVKLRPSDMKIGINRTNLEQRDHGYEKDLGIFDRVITTHSDKQAEVIENSIKATIREFTTQKSQEYFSPCALVDKKGFDACGNIFDTAWEYNVKVACAVESGITGVYDADVIIGDAITEARTDTQRRVTDFFNGGSTQVASPSKRKREVTVRFKLRETDVALKRIDVELLRESEETKRREIDAGVERARIDQREIDATVEIERIKAGVETERIKADVETKQMEFACRRVEAEAALLKEQTQQRELAQM